MKTRSNFPKSAKIRKPAQYKAVFSTNSKFRAGCFLLLYKENCVGFPRLGLVIGKKYLSRAVDRNKVKRLVRESFRQQRKKLPALDLVVLWTQKTDSIDAPSVHKRLDKQWQKLEQLAVR